MADIERIIDIHTDRLELIKAGAEDSIESIFDKIIFKDLVKNPEETLDQVIAQILVMLIGFSEPVISESERYVDSVFNASQETA